MLIVLAIVISIGALLIVAYPIVARPRSAPAVVSTAQEELDELLARRDAAFQALRDLSFDHQVGKVTDDDFTVFEANLKEVAAETLRALDRWEAGASIDLDMVLEQSIAARQAALLRGSRSCSSCGRVAASDDKFCAACGTPLPEPATEAAPASQGTCPKCGHSYTSGDRFCSICGTSLVVAGGAPVAAVQR